MLFAEVAVEAARGLDRETYSYEVPAALDVVPGHRVTVPFGRRSTFGFIVSLGTTDPGVEVKPLRDVSPREIQHDNPEMRHIDEFVHFLGQLYNRDVTEEDTVTVIHFSEIRSSG